jgi:anti-sigma regulatory factor (Ser/Thr protein kinase)
MRSKVHREPQASAAAKRAALERRIGALQVNGRRVNEAIERGVSSAQPTVFVCECGRIGCNTTIALSVAQYGAARIDFDRFLVAPHHHLPDVDRVIARHDRYLIVARHDAQSPARSRARDPSPDSGRPDGGVRAQAAMPERVSVVGGHVRATPEAVSGIRHIVVALAAHHGADEPLCAQVARAVSEAVSNVVTHAYASPADRGNVHFAADVERHALEVVISDDGHGFQPGQGAGAGLGLSVIASSSAHFGINQRQPHGTEVWMRFLLPR